MTTRRDFLAGFVAGPLLLPYAAPAADGDDTLLSKPRLGAAFFLNDSETLDSVFHHFRLMAETGFTVARIFTLWDRVEPDEGKWDFTRYDWVYDAAAQSRIRIANTLCAEDPPGWLGLTPFYHAKEDLSNPRLRPYSEMYIERVVRRYKDHPAHGVWLLQNEPAIRTTKNTIEPYLLAEYARWLESKYRTVENLNKHWYRPLHRFDEAQAPESGINGWSDFAEHLDWWRFQDDHLIEQLRWIHGQVIRYHPGALTHANRSSWLVKPTVDFLGASIHASHDFANFGISKRQDFGLAYSYKSDLLRSFSAPSPWWVTELQGGPQISYSGSRHLSPTGTEITRWLWDGFGNGSRGIVFWLWHPRTEGFEAGEWGLVRPNGEATDRTRAAEAVASVLRKYSDFFSASKPLKARAAILYDRDAMLLYTLDHGDKTAAPGRGGDEVMHSLIGCYKALHRAHVAVDFLDTGQLEASGAGDYRVLYLPNCYALSPGSVAAIREFVRDGGTLWADGLVAWKDEQGATRQFPPGPLSEVFGFTLEDIQPVWEPFAMGGGGDRAGELWHCLIPTSTAQALLKGTDGRPAAVEHPFGKGRALYYGTALTLGYLRREDPQAGEWITAPALAASRDLPVRLIRSSRLISFRALQAPGRLAAVLNNWGAAGRATVQFRSGTQSVVEILSGGNVPLRRAAAGVETEIELDDGGTAILLAATT